MPTYHTPELNASKSCSQGYLSPRPLPSNHLSIYLQNAIPLWNNLHTVVFAPLQYHDELFSTVTPFLQGCHSLHCLVLNASCTQEAQIAGLIEIQKLEDLTILNPTRAILQRLPQWLRGLSDTLEEFHLKVRVITITVHSTIFDRKTPRTTVDLSHQASSIPLYLSSNGFMPSVWVYRTRSQMMTSLASSTHFRI